MYLTDTLYLREQGRKDPRLFFESKRGPPAKNLENTTLQHWSLENELQLKLQNYVHVDLLC
jgi:hypothetical protein